VALSCIVSRAAGGHAVEFLGQRNCASLIEGGDGGAASYSIPKFKAIRLAATQARDALGMAPEQFTHILTNNYSLEVTKMFGELCGFPRDASYLENIGRFAHAVAGDILINLKDLDDRGGVARGDRVLLMADSVTSAASG